MEDGLVVVRIAAGRRGITTERGRAGVADHRRKLGKVGDDPVIHVARVARPDLEELDHIADRRRIELGEASKVLLCQRTDVGHTAIAEFSHYSG